MKVIIFCFLFFAMATGCTKGLKSHRVGIVNLKTIKGKSVWGRSHKRKMNKQIVSREKQWQENCENPLKNTVLKLEKIKKEKDAKPEEIARLQQKKRQLSHKCSMVRQQFKTEIEELNENFASSIINKVKEVAASIAEELQLDLVVSQFRGVVLYGSKQVDITSKVINKLEEGF
ncbi:MAG: OmpH family outer membrane protein [Deltaproteobacteria bacterium]|jgi:Skp family chaperone for outer membrane proteins|nr:OmpH family outer membrane protein [Deltaproteobacteria bacterium]